MATPTVAQVTALIDTDADVQSFIDTAYLLVDEELGDAGLSDDRLTEITKWLAAHLICATDPREQQKTVGKASATFEGQTGLGLDSTRYGQRVKLLDSSGILASLGRARMSIDTI